MILFVEMQPRDLSNSICFLNVSDTSELDEAISLAPGAISWTWLEILVLPDSVFQIWWFGIRAGRFIRAEGLIPRPLGAYEGY